RTSVSSASSLSTSARSAGSPAQAASSRARRPSGGRSAARWNSASTRSDPTSPIPTPPARRRFAQPSGQPGAGEAPLAHDRADRPADDVRRLLDAQPGEVAEQDDLGEVRPFRLQLLDRLVKGQEVLGGRLDEGQALGQLDAGAAAAALLAALA